MKKIIRLTESQIKTAIKKFIREQELTERGKGYWKSEWTEEDQILAMYNALYGIEELGISKQQVMDDVIGSSMGSLSKQTANFSFLHTGKGLNREHHLQWPVYQKYKDIPKSEFKSLCLDIIRKKLENPEAAVTKKKIGQEIGNKRDEINKGREEGFKKAGIDPTRINKMKITNSQPLNPPVEDEPEKPTAKQEVRDYLKSIYDRMVNAKSPEEIKSLSSEIEFIMDYIDMELTDKEQKMVAEMKEFIKNKTILIESEAKKKIQRIKKLNNII